MKTTDVMQALTLAKNSLGSEGTLDILSHFCFVFSAVYAFNDKTATIVEFDSPFLGALRGELLLSFLSGSTAQEIEFEPSESSVKIKLGRLKAELPMIPESSFVFPLDEVLESFDSDEMLDIPLRKDLANALQECLPTVGDDALDSKINGVTITCTKNGLTLYSSDNKTLTKVVNKSGGSKKEISFILHKNSATQLASLIHLAAADSEGVVGTARVGKDSLVAALSTTPGSFFFSHLLAVDPLDFEKVIKQQSSSEVFKIKMSSELEEVLKAAVLLQGRSEEKIEPQCSFSLSKGKVIVKATGANGEVQKQLKPLSAKDEDSKAFTFNPKLLLRVFRPDGIITVLEKCLCVQLQESDSYLHLIALRG